MEPWKPTPEQIEAAEGTTVPDVIDDHLEVLFCGINPGLYSGAVGHHFARPGNRFWKALHRGGFTPRLLSPFEERRLLDYGLGITNLVDRATVGGADLSVEELREGAERLVTKVLSCAPRVLAVLGLTAYRTAFGRPGAGVGLQDHAIGETEMWLLPNPSGLNAHYRIDDFAELFDQLRRRPGAS